MQTRSTWTALHSVRYTISGLVGYTHPQIKVVTLHLNCHNLHTSWFQCDSQ